MSLAAEWKLRGEIVGAVRKRVYKILVVCAENGVGFIEYGGVFDVSGKIIYENVI